MTRSSKGRCLTAMAAIGLMLTAAAGVPVTPQRARPRAAVRPASGDSSFTVFESGQVRPLALSADGALLFAANTPDNRLEIFSIQGQAAQSISFSRIASVPVGLEPVAVAVRSPSEVWVVNHLSDSVSVVDVSDLSNARVVRTLLVGDEPRDIVFAGPKHDRAFITTAHRGQNSPVDPQHTTPGAGRADVWVFDANQPGDPLTILTLFCDTPRALAATPDGATVYAAAFHSGNRTTTVSVGSIPTGGLPPPHANFEGKAAPAVGLIVKFRQSPSDGQMHWLDELDRSWDNSVRLSLPDQDVFAIDAGTTPPVQKAVYSSVGTTLFNMAVNPVTGAVYVSNTDARNDQRFEGPGVFAGHSVRGHLTESRITVLNGAQVLPRHLNKHIDYSRCCDPTPNAESVKSLAFPTDMAVSSDGKKLYVAAFGSSKVGVFDAPQIADDSFVPNTANQIQVSGGGPSGLALDEARNVLYVLTRFDDSISIVDLATRRESAHVAMFNPEPASVTNGRRFLYDAALTSSHGDSACASCHIFGDFDSLAWDLGNPDGALVTNPGPFAVLLGPAQPIHPMKGPMTTQSLRGMDNHGPMHWRGDRTGGNDAASAQPGSGSFDEDAGFKKFNAAFPDLLGRGGQLAPEQMQAFTDFILQVAYPPNPVRNLDNTLTPDQQAGRDFFFGVTSNGRPSDTLKTCNGCHVLDPNGNRASGVARPGFFGTDGQSSFEGEPQLFKVPQLRNLYQKVGKFGASPDAFLPVDATPFMGDQVRGFGFLHDGSADTLFRFHGAAVFVRSILNPGGIPIGAAGDTIRRQLEAFLLAFDSNLAPIVGQQVTLTKTNSAVAGARIDLLESRAAANECDLVAHGRVQAKAAGFLYDPQHRSFNTTPEADLRALAKNSGSELTFTCVPPGSGARIAAEPVIAPAPIAPAAGFVSAANPAAGGALSPGSIASLFGTNLAGITVAAGGAPLPQSLGGAAVRLADNLTPLFFVSPGQINLQVPWVTISQATQVPLQITQGPNTISVTVTLTPYSPGLFTTNAQGSGQAAALIAGTASIVAPTGAFPGSRPAKKGEFVSLYCTGLGDVRNRPAAGDPSPADPLATTLAIPTLTVGDAPANVSFSGLAPGFVGLYQVNFQIPDSAPSSAAVTIVLRIGGVTSNAATIAVQ
jgi:uncharacterized protein (TIGR03437 family)